MKICIVTPLYNSAHLIRDTFDSILNQQEANEFELTYIVYDGKSSDNINELIERRYRYLFAKHGINFHYFSEQDKGIYDAIAKGFHWAGNDHDVFTYINAGDYYSPYALALVSRLFQRDSINWMTGANARYTEKGYLSTCDLPVMYPNWLVRRGVFGKLLPAIQQESTFWSGTLHRKINLDELSGFKYAGDFYLWQVFSNFSQLDIVCAWLAGFRVHSGQVSQVKHLEYMQEFKNISQPLGIFSFVAACMLRLAWHLPFRGKIYLNKNIILV